MSNDTFTSFMTLAERIEQCDSRDELWRVMEIFARNEGLPRVGAAYAAVDRMGTLASPEVRSNCAQSRIGAWIKGKLFARDPMVQRALGSAHSFCWGNEYVAGVTNDPRLRNFYRELAATVRSMFIVPLPRVANGALGIGILGNEMPRAEFEPFVADRRPLLVLAMIYADRRLLELSGKDRRSAIGLLPREAECLEWLATGATVEGAAGQMKIGPRTVEAHLAAAMRKLGAETIAQAVALALKNKLIRP